MTTKRIDVHAGAGLLTLAEMKRAFNGHAPDSSSPLYAALNDGASYRVLAVGRKFVAVLTMNGRKTFLPSSIRRIWS